ncbi:hypothetical protein HMPREF0290_3001, partial [Corynebacterium efficiens YS-314]
MNECVIKEVCNLSGGYSTCHCSAFIRSLEFRPQISGVVAV